MVSEQNIMISESAENPEHDSYVEFNEFEDVVASIRLLGTAARLVRDDPSYWKWVLLAAHSALQGACICRLTQTDGSGALDRESEIALRRYHNLSSQKAITEAHGGDWILGEPEVPKKEKVANLHELLRRLPKDLAIYLPQNGDCPQQQPDLDIWRLHDFRNQFIHFRSLHWVIDRKGFPRIARSGLDLTEKIASLSDYPRVNRFDDLRPWELFDKARSNLNAL